MVEEVLETGDFAANWSKSNNWKLDSEVPSKSMSYRLI